MESYTAYQQPTKINSKLMINSFFLILIAGPALGVVYGLLIRYSPLVFLNFLFAGIPSFGLAFLASKIIEHSLAVHFTFQKITVFIGLCVSYYISWIAWLYAFSGYETLFLKPVEIFNAMQMIAVDGAWRIKSLTPTGLFLYAIWFMELLLFIGLFQYFTNKYLKRKLVCPSCFSSINNLNFLKKVEYITGLKTMGKIHLDPINKIIDMEEIDNGIPYAKVGVEECKICNKHWLSVFNFSKENNNDLDDEDIVIDRFLITEQEKHKLLD